MVFATLPEVSGEILHPDFDLNQRTWIHCNVKMDDLDFKLCNDIIIICIWQRRSFPFLSHQWTDLNSLHSEYLNWSFYIQLFLKNRVSITWGAGGRRVFLKIQMGPKGWQNFWVPSINVYTILNEMYFCLHRFSPRKMDLCTQGKH